MTVEKLYESNNYIVINKPFDMYINSDDPTQKNTVTYNIASPDSHLATSMQPLHFVQRLDYSTSGVLCVAKNKSAAAEAGKLFEKRLTEKYYLAIVRGHVGFELADVEYEIGIDPSTDNSIHKMCALAASESFKNCTQSRAAYTRMLVLETGYYDGDPVSVLLLKPITGRRHQLRVHCFAVGHTILGDYTYSGAQDCSPHRMFLHATRLVLPLRNEPLDIITQEPFFSDPQLVAKWSLHRNFYMFRTKQDFLKICNVIDKSYVMGVKYKLFSCKSDGDKKN